MSYWGDFPLEETLNFLFTTRAFATGIPTVLAGTPVLSVYEDTNLTQITAGVTITVDHDAVVGLNRANVVATAANGYEVGKSYNVVITTGTVGGVSVVGEVIGIFTIERSSMADAAITTAKFAVGAINNAAIATDAIGDAELAANAFTNSQLADSFRNELLSANGFNLLTADSGTVNTLVDAELTQADDFFNGMIVVFTGGSNNGLARTITDFDAATDTLTLAPDLLVAVAAGHTYYIAFFPGVVSRDGVGDADVKLWQAVSPNALVSGAVDSDVSAIQANVITAASIATDAITAAKIAANAIGASELATDAIGDAQIATGAIASTAFAAGAIDAAAIAADAIGASELATDAIGSAQLAISAINEIRDAILSDATTFAGANIDATISSRATPAQVNTEVSDVLKTDTITLPGQLAPPLTPTFEEALSWLYKVLRNRKTQTATQWSLLADDESTVDAKATVSDDATTAIKQEIVTGP